MERTERKSENKAVEALRAAQGQLAASREGCDDGERALWDLYEEGIRSAEDAETQIIKVRQALIDLGFQEKLSSGKTLSAAVIEAISAAK